MNTVFYMLYTDFRSSGIAASRPYYSCVIEWCFGSDTELRKSETKMRASAASLGLGSNSSHIIWAFDFEC